MRGMFEESNFNNASIEHWDTSRVNHFSGMFKYAKFQGDLSRWHLKTVASTENMFSSTFQGILPNQHGYPPLPRYEQFLGGSAYLEHYLKTVPFNMVHATIALTVDVQHYPEALAHHQQWLAEQRAILQGLGCPKEDTARLLVEAFHGRTRPHAAHPIAWGELLL